MNPISIREELKAMFKLNVINADELHRGLHAPLFLSHRNTFLTKTEREWCEQNCMESNHLTPKLPFNDLILHVTHENTPVTYYYWKTINREPPPTVHVVAWIHNENGYVQVDYTDIDKSDVYVRGWKDGKCVNYDSIDPTAEIRERFGSIAMIPMAVLLAFAFDTMTPKSTILQVKPKDKPGKSVQWTIARTHYLIINHKQAQQCRDTRTVLSGLCR